MKHIIIIGFKHVGKSVVAEGLANELARPHIDLDTEIMVAYEKETGFHFSCAKIVEEQGLTYFRLLEHMALRSVLSQSPAAVISLGGGTPVEAENQRLILPHTIIHLTAPKGGIYERIMMNGRPAYFPKDKDPYIFFHTLWAERDPIYRSLATYTIENTGSINDAVADIVRQLQVVVMTA